MTVGSTIASSVGRSLTELTVTVNVRLKAAPPASVTVTVITADRERWVDTMLAEEYGLPKVVRAPLKAAASTFAAFLLCGSIPLLPFLFETARRFEVSVVMTALVFFLIGSTKSRWSPVSWWRSGAETLAIGLGAAALAFLVGYGLKTLV